MNFYFYLILQGWAAAGADEGGVGREMGQEQCFK